MSTFVSKLSKLFMFTVVSIFAVMAISGCSETSAEINSDLPEAPEVSSAEEALDSGYIDEVITGANENFENLGLDPEEDYAYWMSIKQIIDPDSNDFKNALYMGDLRYLDSTKTTFDGIINVISEYDYVNTANKDELVKKVNALYEYVKPFCNENEEDVIPELEVDNIEEATED